MIIKGNNVGYPLPDPRKGLEMQGGINMNGHPISGLNAPTANDQAANMGYVKKAAPRNLLDNSDFKNPVNQRGAGGSYAAWGGYTIDRWSVDGTGATLVLYPESIGIQGGIFQRLNNPQRFSDKTLTFAAKIYGHIFCCSGTVTFNNKWSRVAEYVANDTRIEITTQDNNELWVGICNTGRNETYLEWTALYEGEYTAQTLPEYRAKGYMVEALNCGALTVHKTLTLSANGWSSSTPYTQTVAVEGILGTDTPHYSVVYSADTETALAQKEAFAMVDDLDTTDGSVKFTCFEEKPEVDLTIQLEVNR